MPRFKGLRRRPGPQSLNDGEIQAVLGTWFPLRQGVATSSWRGVLPPYRMPVVVHVGPRDSNVAIARFAAKMTIPASGPALCAVG
jgi:hypothetical protein